MQHDDSVNIFTHQIHENVERIRKMSLELKQTVST